MQEQQVANHAGEQPRLSAEPRGSAEPRCLACGKGGAQHFFDLKDVPVLCNAPCATQAKAAAFPTGQIRLAFCRHCGMVFNSAFAPELIAYDQQYENSLHYSHLFDKYVRDQASDLVSRCGLRGKDIIEIGCGKGDFLAILCDLGVNRAVGFDPSYEPDRFDSAAAGRLQIVRDLYSEAYGHLACDLLCCRQTLEHVPEPAVFLNNIRRALGSTHDRTVVFFEVPNVLYTLRHKGIWDIIYEHVSYFWSAPLTRLFSEAGFAVQTVRETYGHQFLCLEAVPDSHKSAGYRPDSEQMDRVAEEVRVFGQIFDSTLDKAAQVLEDAKRRGQRAVVWGTGSKGVTFMNLFKDHALLEYAVDINPHKQGKYVPGTGHPIVAPEFLSEYKPELVFVMNPLYQTEIGQRLAELSVQADLVAV